MRVDESFQEIVKLFFKYKIIQLHINKSTSSSQENPSPFFFDHRALLSYPLLRKKILENWCALVREEVQNLSSLVFVGMATAGIAPAYALAERFDAGFIYVRCKPKSSGTGSSSIEGAFAPNSVFVVVDDLVTTGNSLLSAVEKIQENNGKVVLMTSVLHHDIKVTNHKFAQRSLPFKSLFKMTDLFDCAYGMNLLSGKEMRLLMEWLTSVGEQEK